MASPTELTPEEQELIDSERTHPLENEWTFSYDRRTPQKKSRGETDKYEENIQQIGDFSTVEDFWRYYNHIKKPSCLPNYSNYHLFKKGIKPMWEDDANLHGGKWTIALRDRALLDEYWNNLVLGLIGETLDDGDEICGGVVSRRKNGDKIAIWNKSHDKDAVMEIGYRIKKLLALPEGQMSYSHHEDSMRSGASYTNPEKYSL